jgi:PAS domain S-box-containing protein
MVSDSSDTNSTSGEPFDLTSSQGVSKPSIDPSSQSNPSHTSAALDPHHTFSSPSLLESEDILRSIYDGVEHAIFVVDVMENDDFRYVAHNPAHERLTGIPSQNFAGKTPEQVLSLSAAAAARRRYIDCVRTEASISYEECLSFQGEQTWWLTRLTPLRNNQSRIYRLIGTSMDISERKRVEEALRQRVERERLVGAIAQRIRRSLDLDEILNTTVVEMRQLLQTDRVLVYRLESNLSGTVVVESVAPGWRSLLNETITDACFTKDHLQPYRQGLTTARPDIYAANVEPCYSSLLASFQVQALLVVPILQGETLWGLLIAHQCDAPRQWQVWEITLLKQLATQVGIAIQQSQLYQTVQQLNTHLEKLVNLRTTKLQEALNFEALLKRITDKVRDTLDKNQILQVAVEELTLLSVVDCCTASIYDLEHGLSVIDYESSLLACSFRERSLHMAEYFEVYRQLLQGQYFQFCLLSDGLAQRHMAILACPIADDERVLGDLWLVKPKEYGFDELEIRLVQQVANQCAIALRQSRLYHLAQTQVKELERLHQLKNEFFDYVSQELRSPMANIHMATQMLEIQLQQLDILGGDPSPITRYFQILKQECRRETQRINHLLDLEWFESKAPEDSDDEETAVIDVEMELDQDF